MRRLLSLNIRHGGGSRIPRVLEWIEGQHPDLVVLLEWRASNDQLLSVTLKHKGFELAKFSKSGARDNGIVVAAKDFIRAERITPKGADKGELVLVSLHELSLCAAYFPQGNNKATYFQELFELAVRHTDVPFLVVGDINTGNNQVDLPNGATRFACSNMFDALSREHGMTDLWRRQHGPQAQEWTWHSAKNGFRIDHAFANHTFLATFPRASCYYNHDPKKLKITDHSALIIDF